MGAFGAWLEHRTGCAGAIRRFFAEPIPASTGWRQTLGSLAGALLLVQILSGLLLAVYYVPHPDAAYESIQYIEQQVIAGRLVRALHYWGASCVVVAVFLHMARVFFTGAYKAPREATWLAGVALVIVVLLLAFTGQLLPWNQMGFWSASVGLEIASSAPLVGPSIKRLLTGGSSLGALTLTRFYAIHLVLLPAALGLLVGIHLYLLRRHGPARGARDSGTAVAPFHPVQFARDTTTISIGLAALFLIAALAGGPESGRADPGDATYIPRPEWYFQAHYQILRLTPGPFRVLATFVLPTAMLALLLALPWIDRAKGAAVRERPAIVGAGSLVIAIIAALTGFGIATHPEATSAQPPRGASYDIIEAGRAVYAKEDCKKCHTIGLEGGDEGRDLSGVGLQLQEAYLRKFLRNPAAYMPDIDMPPFKGSEREMDELMAYLKSLREEP